MARRDALAAQPDALGAREAGAATPARCTRGEAISRPARGHDYHLVDASYELAVDAAFDTEPNADSLAIAPLRSRAIGNLGTFLSRYPQSIARGETRFRLADLLLMQARDDFQVKMAAFLGQAPSADQMKNRAAALCRLRTRHRALSLILAEDSAFRTRTPCLQLNDPLRTTGSEAATYLTRLVDNT
jgi:hypothetical protein